MHNEMNQSSAVRICWHRLTHSELTRELRSNSEDGLTVREARCRLEADGPNELPEAPRLSMIVRLLQQFASPIIWVLIGAAVVSGLLQDWVDAAAIMAIVLLNGIIGFVQEYKAERALASLGKLSVLTARVIRDGVLQTIAARELVPGDLIQVEAGDHIPADGRLIYSTDLRTQEAALTGESSAALKSSVLISQAEVPLGDRHNLIFMGTVAVSGKARALVIQTGSETELGRIARLIQTATQTERTETPLQRRLEHLGLVLLWLSLGIVAVVFVLGILRGEPLGLMFLTAVSLAVAAIPEGLPAVVTIALALGVMKMVRRHALIRRLPAIETLGAATVICSDKTGTLTKNEMTVTALYDDQDILNLTGEGYRPVGDILLFGNPVRPDSRLGLMALFRAAALCNGAELQQHDGSFSILGDPTEGALLVAAAKAGLWKSDLEKEALFLGEVPFDAERKKMTIVRRTSSGPVAYVKGAADVLLHDCTGRLTHDGTVQSLCDENRRDILEGNRRFASQGLRVLAIAMRPLEQEPERFTSVDLEQNLIFLGLLGMKDPIRPEAKAAVKSCRIAGIKTVMITGDHKDTAVAIAGELGLLDGELEALSGLELNHCSDAELVDRVERIAVYARVSAEHKLRVVRAWKQRGAIVAMTGDGVNDAPAIKEADIGIAMGITGTDVTKEASDMVVTDDNFASIAAAIEEGRGIYDNIRKAVQYLLAGNFGEVLVMLIAALLGLPLPLLPVQILWMNLVTDSLPALALTGDPKDPDLMRRPPRDPEARFLDRGQYGFIAWQGVGLAIITLLAFGWSLRVGGTLEHARTLAFTVLIGGHLTNALNCRSNRYSLFQLGLTTNMPLLSAVVGSAALQAAILATPWSRRVFGVTTLESDEWLLIMVLGLLPMAVMEMWKLGVRGFAR